MHTTGLLFDGVRVCSGILLDVPFLGERIVRQRIVESWTTGSRVYRCDAGLVVIWSQPRWVDARVAPGALVLAVDQGYTAVDLKPRHSTDAIGPTVTYLRDGLLAQATLDAGSVVDPGEWLDPGPFIVAQPRPWPAAGAQPVVVESDAARSIREVLGERMPDRAGSAREYARILKAISEDKIPWGSNDSRDPAGVIRATRFVTAVLARWLHSLLSGPGTASERAEDGSRTEIDDKPEAMPKRRGILSRWFNAWLRQSALRNILDQRQARYLSRLFAMFEEGALDDALRHAPSLTRGKPDKQDELDPGIMRPRDHFTISPRGTTGSAKLVGGKSVYQQLRAYYRRAVGFLERKGEIALAVFVLAELLGEKEEAVNLFERHGHLREAAELAESQALAPGLVVRQWFLAGDTDRAVSVARRTGAFADAIVRLDKRDPDRADDLRVVWAGLLAEAGRFGEAVEVIWPVSRGRRMAVEWVRRAIAIGGETGSRMLVRQLLLERDALPDILPQAQRCLSRTCSEELPERLAIADELLRQAPRLPAAARPLGIMACRAMVRDAGLGMEVLTRKKCGELAAISGDRALAADIPPFKGTRGKPRSGPLKLDIAATEQGRFAALDAACLPRGRVLVAHGEAGAGVYAADGRRIMHFDVPAQWLVIGDGGARALAIAERGELYAISQLDLERRRSRRWGELALTVWADSYDGSHWFAAHERTLYILDALASQPTAVWRIPDVDGLIQSVSRGARLHFLVTGNGLERWSYDIDGFALRERRELLSDAACVHWAVVNPDGFVVAADLRAHDGLEWAMWRTWTPMPGSLVMKPGSTCRVGPAILVSNALVYASETGDASNVVAARDGPKPLLSMTLAGAQRVSLRHQAGRLVVGDDHGRVVTIFCENGMDNARLGAIMRT